MLIRESRPFRLSTYLPAVACGIALLATSGTVWGDDQGTPPDLSARIVGRLRDPILPHAQTVCHAVMLEGVAKSRGYTGRILIAADPQAHVVTVQVTDAGPANFSYGVTGAQAWFKGAGGVVSDADFDGYRAGLVSDAYWASGGLSNVCWPAQVHYMKADKVGGVAADVLEVLPEGGRTTQVWISRKTQLPLRWSRRDEPDTATMSYANYGHGKTLGIPFKQTLVDRDGNRWDFTIKQVHAGVAPATVAAQAQKPASANDFSIDGGVSTTVPMRLTQQPHIDLMIDGRGPFNFLLDTGGSLVLTQATAKTLGLKLSGAGHQTGITGGATAEKFTLVKDVQIGAAHIQNQYAEVMRAGPDPETAGAIGYEVLARFTTTFDFPKQQLTLALAPASPDVDAQYSLPLVLDHTVPVLKATLNGIDDYLWLDTGYNSTLLVNTPFAKAHAAALPQKLYDTGASLSGIGGGGGAKLGRIAHVTIGKLELNDVVAIFGDFPAGPSTDAEFAAIAGDALFHDTVLTLDYRSRRAWLVPASAGPASAVMPYNQAGFGLDYQAGAAAAKVAYVRESSPAAEVGLHVGDQVVAINVQGISGATVAALVQQLKTQDNTPIRLTVLRDGQVTDFTIQPRAYIQ